MAYIVYLLGATIVFSFLALYFLNRARAITSRNGISIHVSAKEFLRSKKGLMDGWLDNSKLQQQFKAAGNPLGLTGMTYQYIRFGLLLLYFMVSLPKFLTAPDLKSLFGLIAGAGFLFMLSMPGEYLPITRLLMSIKDYNIAEKNRELFMVYSLISDEIIAAKNQRMNLLSLLEEMREYTTLIRPAIDRALLNWSKGTNHALQIMAIEIGTPEADELTKILADLEEYDTDKAIELLGDRQETFIGAQKENKRRKLKTLAQYGYVVAFVPMIIYGWNMMGLVTMEVKLITDFTNLR